MARFALFASCIALTVLCAACTAPAPTATPIPPLDAADVLNTQYPNDMTSTGYALLKDGKFQEPIVNGSSVMVTIQLYPDMIALGDLNGDGAGDAALILATNGGGSGTFMTLEAVTNGNGVPLPVARVSLGDRIKCNALRIADRVITAELVVHGPSDPLCCPTQAVVKRWKLEGEALVELP